MSKVSLGGILSYFEGNCSVLFKIIENNEILQSKLWQIIIEKHTKQWIDSLPDPKYQFRWLNHLIDDILEYADENDIPGIVIR